MMLTSTATTLKVQALQTLQNIMQIFSARPLIEKFRDDTFEESEVGSYFMAYMISLSVAWLFAFGETNPWEFTARVSSIVITVFGTYHLKQQNGDSFGNRFASKFFCLGWIVSIRLLVLAFPAAMVFFALAAKIGGSKAGDPAGAILTIVFEILFYWWLGLLIEQTNHPKCARGTAGQPSPAILRA